MIQLQHAQIDVTPKQPLKLAGFAFRTGCYERIGMPIYLSCLIINEQYIVFNLDALWWGDDICQKISTYLQAQYPEQSLHIIYHATHSHSGPQLQRNLSPSLGEISEEYVDFLIKKACKLVHITKAKPVETCHISKLESECNFAIYRRVTDALGKCTMAPNFDHDMDSSVRITLFHQKNDICAIWLHFQCHPTITGDNILSGEYPGVVRAVLQEYYPNATIQILQGFGADIRPHFDPKNHEIMRLSYDAMCHEGQKLAGQIHNHIQHKQWQKLSGDACVHMRYETIMLPLEKIYSAQALKIIAQDAKETIQKEWAEHFLRQPYLQQTIALKLGFLRIHPQLALLCINAEVCHGYAQALLAQYPDILPLGYSNGMVGYIPMKHHLAEGGYEPEDSIYYFYMPAMFDPSLESALMGHFQNIINKEEEHP